MPGPYYAFLKVLFLHGSAIYNKTRWILNFRVLLRNCFIFLIDINEILNHSQTCFNEKNFLLGMIHYKNARLGAGAVACQVSSASDTRILYVYQFEIQLLQLCSSCLLTCLESMENGPSFWVPSFKWDTWKKFLVPSADLAQPWPLRTFEGVNQ